MTLTPPSLDDLDFDRLTRDAEALIPRYFPAWTDRNPSDPGITLIELFAQLIEAAVYHLDRVPERSLEHFAALAGVTRREGPPPARAPEAIGDTLRRAYEAVRARERAVLAEDFVALVLAGFPEEVARVHAAVRSVGKDPIFPDEMIIEVTVLPDAPGDPAPLPSSELLSRVFALLDERRLITTRIAVVPPAYRRVIVEAEIVPAAGLSDLAALRVRVEDAIRAFLDPLRGGVDGAGWPFGRPLYRSELYHVLEGLDGVDHVVRLELGAPGIPGRDRIDAPTPTSLMRLDRERLRIGVRTG